jgi:autotransporter-associated beta strand protein
LTDCRSPFSDSCCETKQSSGQSLVFTQPFFYKFEPFDDTLRATVSGTTTSPILIHGTLLATEATSSNRCNYNHSFVLCGDSFYIEPISYEYGFHNLEAEVCWTQESVQEETLNFSGSNNLDIVLGTSKYNCITTLSYTGNGHTSNSSITLDGDSVIDGSGDELVLTGQITSQSENLSTLTLSGDSLNNNISGIISGNTRVIKDGPGSWKLTGNNTFTERLEVKSGTLVVSSVVFSGSSPIGENAEAPIIGDDNSGASFLLENATLNRGGLSIIPGTGIVTIGSIGLSTFSNSRTIELGRDVTLQASPSGIATFSNTWTDINGSPNPSGSINIGSVDNDGVVVFDSLIPDTISSININYGTLQIDIDVPEYNGTYGPIAYATPMYIYGATLSLNNVDQSLSSISFEEPISNINGEGTLRLYNSSGSATLNINSSNNTISSNISLDSSAVLSGDGSLTILGIISGANNLVKNDSGSVTLSVANTYSGTTTINGGIMVAGHISAFGTGNIIINSGATLDRNGFTLANNITNNGGIILN